MHYAIENHDKMWFGVLLSPSDTLLASGFSRDKHKLKEHLDSYSLKISGKLPEEKPNRLAGELAGLFEAKVPQEPVDLATDFVSKFQSSVYRVLRQIPLGKVTTYGRIAKALDSAPRAVGGAVGSNPWPLFVPCHRVIPSSRLTGNYSMNGAPSHQGSLVKRGILEREGVPFIEDLVDPSALWKP